MSRCHFFLAFAMIVVGWDSSLADTIRVPKDYPTIQDAIIAAQPSDTIIVSSGIYLENIHFMGKAITLTSTAPNDPAVVAATVIRSAASEGSQTVHFLGNENAETSLIGFTITGAHTGSNGTIASLGGGVGCNEASPTISHCVITGNTALAGGGLAYCHGLIEDCTIEGNIASPAPGASGGGLHRCNGIVRNCRILGNQAPSGGGVDSCDAAFESCIIAGNIATAGGGVTGGNNIRLRNCTIVGNYGQHFGGGILASQGQIVNCILWDNVSEQPGGSQVDFNSSVQPTFSCIQGGGGGTGSIDTNPDFVDPGSWGGTSGPQWIQGNYRLQSSSPCIDAGNSSIVPTTDVTGHPRVVGAAVEMGAYEFGDCNGDGLYDPQEIADGIVPDCNGNQIPDECDVGAGTSIDCNSNGIPDECDIANCSPGDTSCQDCNGNGIMNGCEPPGQYCQSDADCDDGYVCTIDFCSPGNCTCDHMVRDPCCEPTGACPCSIMNCELFGYCCDPVTDYCVSRPAPQADPTGISKSRFISMKIPELSATGSLRAVRVILTSLHHVNPPYSGGASVPFSNFEGQIRWIGPPGDCAESEVQHTTFKCATLQCTPAYEDWDAELNGATLHVTGAEIVPSSLYDVQLLDASCQGMEGTCTAASCPLRVATARWGDVVLPFQLPPPNQLTQPSISDISVIVDKFKDVPTAIVKARAQLQPQLPDPTKPVDIRDIASSVDSFKGFAYPFTIPPSCP